MLLQTCILFVSKLIIIGFIVVNIKFYKILYEGNYYFSYLFVKNFFNTLPLWGEMLSTPQQKDICFLC